MDDIWMELHMYMGEELGKAPPSEALARFQHANRPVFLHHSRVHSAYICMDEVYVYMDEGEVLRICGRYRDSYLETLIIRRLDFNPNYYTLALILLIKIVVRSKVH